MTQLEAAMALTMEVFDTYAKSDVKKNTLCKSELKKLVECELPGLLKDGKGKDECDKLMKDLDANKDDEVDFKEFIVLIATLTCLVHEKFQECTKK